MFRQSFFFFFFLFVVYVGWERVLPVSTFITMCLRERFSYSFIFSFFFFVCFYSYKLESTVNLLPSLFLFFFFIVLVTLAVATSLLLQNTEPVIDTRTVRERRIKKIRPVRCST